MCTPFAGVVDSIYIARGYHYRSGTSIGRPAQQQPSLVLVVFICALGYRHRHSNVTSAVMGDVQSYPKVYAMRSSFVLKSLDRRLAADEGTLVRPSCAVVWFLCDCARLTRMS